MSANRNIKNANLQRIVRNTRWNGRMLALFGLAYIVFTTGYDLTSHQNQFLFFFRIGSFMTLAVFLLATQLRPRLKYQYLISFYLISSAILIIMACSMVVSEFKTPTEAPIYIMTSATGRLMTITLILYFCSGGISPYLHYLFTIPTIFLIFYAGISLQIDREALSFLINPVMVIFAILFDNYRANKHRRQEFSNTQLTEYRKSKLETEIVKHRHQLRTLEKQATHDDLTNLFNRRVAFSVLEKHFNPANECQIPVTVCFIDVDQLKQVNDSKGHAAGDKLLRKVACSLREHVRCSDYICRLGGDEFLIIFPGCPLPIARSIVKTIREDLNTNHQIDFSYGFATYPQDSLADPNALIATADHNMYQNKISKQKARLKRE